jgi:hypothetical protein
MRQGCLHLGLRPSFLSSGRDLTTAFCAYKIVGIYPWYEVTAPSGRQSEAEDRGLASLAAPRLETDPIPDKRKERD